MVSRTRGNTIFVVRLHVHVMLLLHVLTEGYWPADAIAGVSITVLREVAHGSLSVALRALVRDAATLVVHFLLMPVARGRISECLRAEVAFIRLVASTRRK
jgi:hypothetical protein